MVGQEILSLLLLVALVFRAIWDIASSLAGGRFGLGVVLVVTLSQSRPAMASSAPFQFFPHACRNHYELLPCCNTMSFLAGIIRWWNGSRSLDSYQYQSNNSCIKRIPNSMEEEDWGGKATRRMERKSGWTKCGH